MYNRKARAYLVTTAIKFLLYRTVILLTISRLACRLHEITCFEVFLSLSISISVSVSVSF